MKPYAPWFVGGMALMLFMAGWRTQQTYPKRHGPAHVYCPEDQASHA